MYGSVGKMAFAGRDLTTNQAILGLEVRDTQRLFNRYIYYWMLSQKKLFLFQAQGVTQKNLSATFVRNLKIPLPPLEEQKRLAAILDKADEIRRKRQEAIKLTEQLLRSLFLDMFGDPVTNPREWEVKTIGEITRVETGGTPSRKNNDFYYGEICWVKTTEVKGDIIKDTEEKLTKEGLDTSNCKIFPKETLIVAMYGQGATRGRSAKLGIESATNQACAAILPSDNIKTNYLWTYISLSYERLRDLGRGGNQPNLNLSMIRNFQIMIPPLYLQEKFVKVMGQIDRIKNHQKMAKEKDQEVFNSLLQKAFRGQL